MTGIGKRYGNRRVELESIAAVMAACLLIGCTPGQDASVAERVVSGTAIYRERMMLPPGAVLEVLVLDTARADAPATTIASIRIEDPGAPPFAFEIRVPAAAITPRGRFVVRATIERDGELLMTTDTAYPVLSDGSDTVVELVLRSVRRNGGTATQPDASQTGELVAALPATFVGVLPCADCPGIEYHLDLLPGSAAYLQRTYLERDLTIDAIGAWSSAPAGEVLAVWDAGREPIRFAIVAADTLRLLDRNGEAIESRLNYELSRAAGFDPATLSLSLRGMYVAADGSASFTECESGRRFAVAEEADAAALRQAHSAIARAPDDALLVSFAGRITMRPPPEGSGMQPSVIVEAFTGIWPTETCGARMSVSALLDSNWVLTRLGDEAVVLGDNMREPRLVLHSGRNEVTGFTGCNNFTGAARISGSAIELGPIAANLRACATGGRYESGLFAALENAARFVLYRHHLELYDSDDTLLARFESRAVD